MMDNREPFVYKTADYGRTWTKITGDLPTGHPLAYAMSVAENPNKRGMLFAGTGNGFYYSRDDGAHWTRIKEGLPAAPVTWIVAPKARWHDVVVSTYGRGDLRAARHHGARDGRDATGRRRRRKRRWQRANAPIRVGRPTRFGCTRRAPDIVRHAPATLISRSPFRAVTAEPAKLEIMDSTGCRDPNAAGERRARGSIA